MKVLIFVDDFYDGAGNMAQILAHYLSEKEYSVSLCLNNLHSKKRYPLKNIEIYDNNLSLIRGNKLSIFFKMIKQVREVIKKDKPDIIISFIDNNNTLACLAARNMNIPIIVSERSNPLAIYPKFPWNYLRTFAYRYADVISVQFDEFKKFSGGRFMDKCVVTHNIIEETTHRKNFWSENKVSFISLGRYATIKRFELMINLFYEFSKDKDDVILEIFGNGIKNEKLSRLIQEKHLDGKVILNNAVKNVHEELVKHDIYLMTSEQEGFPNALSEAMAVGLPIIAFKCHSGISQLVVDDYNGFCIDESDQEGFIRAMNEIYKDSKKRKLFGEHSNTISAKYNSKIIFEEWESCIKRAIRSKRNTIQ